MGSGTLYIVATPLGNLADITYRAVTVLKEADLIAAEDTRHSRRLLSHYGITTPLVSCHEHNEERMAQTLIPQLEQGKTIALISDAGTPTISDPGYRLVRRAAQCNAAILPIPGCSAVVAGLSVSGLPTDQFLFAGFLPKKEGRRRSRLEALAPAEATLVFYESPHRIVQVLTEMIHVMGDRDGCLAREITKKHEEYIRGSLSHILATLTARDRVRGECALFLRGSSGTAAPSLQDLETIVRERLATTTKGTAKLAKEISKEFNCSKKEIYDLILTLKA